MRTQQTPSEHYLQAARIIVQKLFPNESSEERHEKIMFTWRIIMEAALDVPTKNQGINS